MVVLLIFSRSDIARTESPCSCVSRNIDRMSFTSVSLACFRLAIHEPLVQIEVQNDKTARAKVDLFIAERLSGIYRNTCPGISGNAVRDLMESLSANYRNPQVGGPQHRFLTLKAASVARVVIRAGNDDRRESCLA